jgi:uncharacterized protein (TIGR01244 family)
MSVTDIYNFIQIDDLVATAGQPSEEQFRQARDAGYDVVINLAPDGLETSLPDESGMLASLGIDYHHIPVAWAEPRLDQLEAFEAAMDAAAGKRMLIHCQANYRVTAFYSLYAMAKLGWSEERADALIARIWASRPGYQMDDVWKGFIAAGRQRHT